MKFTWYNDPAHGWLRVPIVAVVQVGASENITPYSYMHGQYAYLEEDQDASTFIKAWKEFTEDPIEFSERYTDNPSKIRSYASYNHEHAEIIAVFT